MRLQSLQQLRTRDPVDDSVITRQRYGHHRSEGNTCGCLARPPFTGADCENRGLRWIDDR